MSKQQPAKGNPNKIWMAGALVLVLVIGVALLGNGKKEQPTAEPVGDYTAKIY